MTAASDTVVTVGPERASVRVMTRATAEGSPGTLLVLVHGAGSGYGAYDELLPHLAPYDAWAPALPGRAGSSGPAQTSVVALARWLDAIVVTAGDRPVVLAGHSLGGAIAIELALRASEVNVQLAGLVLMNTGARLRVHPAILAFAREHAERNEPMGFPVGALEGVGDALLEARIDAVARATPPASAWADWQASDGFDRLNDVAAVAVRTLVIVADDDALTPVRYARHLADGIPRAQLVRFDRGGHMLPFVRPAEVAREIRAFVAGLGQSP